MKTKITKKVVQRIFGRRSLLRDESGAAAVELALVSPFLLMMMVSMVDLGSLFFVQNNMHTAARASARALATQAVTVAQAKTLAEDKLSNWGDTFVVVATEPDPSDPTDTDVVVTISVPMSDVVPVGLIFDLVGALNGTVQSEVAMRQEV